MKRHIVITRREGERVNLRTPDGYEITVTLVRRDRGYGQSYALWVDADEAVKVSREIKSPLDTPPMW